MENQKVKAIIYAVLAAFFYAVNMPFSKLLLIYVPSVIMAGLLYCGAGIGIGIMFLINLGRTDKKMLLSKADIPYAAGMVLLDILAPISLMYGLLHTTAANASLLNNFEIAATTVIALFVFGECVSRRLWLAVSFVTVSSVILSFEDMSGFRFSSGSIFVLLATVFWGFENNCTRKISGKNTCQIVAVKGIGSGIGSLLIGFSVGERFPSLRYIVLALLLGFVAYGLSIFFYIRHRRIWARQKRAPIMRLRRLSGCFCPF